MLNMMTSQIYKTVLEKCNYESLFCMVLLKAVAVFLKTKCNVTCYAAYVSSFMNKRHNELDGLNSGTALFLLENFRIIVCAILYRKSSEDNEGADSILL